MRGDVVSQGHLGHVSQVLHKVLAAVREGGRQHRRQAKEQRGPGSVVGSEQVVHVYAALCGHQQVDEEHRGQERKGDGGLVLLQRGPLVDEGGRDGLEGAHQSGHGGQDHEAEEQAGPEPVELDRAEGGLGQGDADEPEAGAGDGGE